MRTLSMFSVVKVFCPIFKAERFIICKYKLFSRPNIIQNIPHVLLPQLLLIASMHLSCRPPTYNLEIRHYVIRYELIGEEYMNNAQSDINKARYYTVNHAAKILGCNKEEVRELLRNGKLAGDDGFGVYQRILGDSIVRHIEKRDHFQEEVSRSGKDGFSFYKNMNVENITKQFNDKIKRGKDGHSSKKKWHSAYSGA